MAEQPEDNTPVIVGVAQCSEELSVDLVSASSFVDLASQALASALNQTGVGSLASHIDCLVATRGLVDSDPSQIFGFGRPDNHPAAIAKRVGATPKRCVLDCVGGQTPQKLVGEFFSELYAGTCDFVALCGSEVVQNVRAAQRQNIALDWSEQIGGEFEDRGLHNGTKLSCRADLEHQMFRPIQYYGLMETARRGRLGLNKADYELKMGEFFEQFSAVARNNPHALDRRGLSAAEIIADDPKNPEICSPYRKNLIAKDGVNLAAAVVMTTVGKARSLGIPEEHWVYLHGQADSAEPVLLERPDISSSPAMQSALKGALESASITADDIAAFDLYSCFPIVPMEACAYLGIKNGDPRPITMTGGLPFFGGPGNNYSMHGIVEVVEFVRQKAGAFGLVYANGGWMSKHSVGVYSTRPSNSWKPFDSTALQSALDRLPKKVIEYRPRGEALLESYIIEYVKGEPVVALIVASMKDTGRRCYAISNPKDTQTFKRMVDEDCLGETVFIDDDPRGNRYAFDEQTLAQFKREPVTTFKASYEFCTVQRQGHVITVTINRPAVRNALHPPANQELEDVFNAFEADDDLRVAILTAADHQSFSAGNDLKHLAAGNPVWVPRTGFAGLTSRKGRCKPVIAAVNGAALGGGFEIALACDIIIAADHAVFGLTEPKVGLFAGAGGLHRLTRQIGKKLAMDMILTAKIIDAKTAESYGFVNEVVSAGKLQETAAIYAEKIAALSPASIRTSMYVVNESSRIASEQDAVDEPVDAIDLLINTMDFFEGSKAFAEKRPPRWLGK